MEKIVEFVKDIISRINDAEVTGLSAQLAYFFLLSLFPFLLFLVTLLGYFPLDDRAIINVLAEYLPNEVVNMIDNNLSQIINNRSGGLLSVGIIGTLWSASNGFNAVKRSFNKAYDVEDDKNYIVSRLIAIGLMLAMVIVIISALLLQVFGRVIGDFLFSLIDFSDLFLQLWTPLRWVITSLMFFIVFYALYKIVPNIKMKHNSAIWGTLFATIGWQAASFVFSFYVNTLGNFSVTYGSLGTVIILMIWFYLSGIIITTGGVINAYVNDQKKKEELIDDVIEKS